jgi:predicted nucleic acid-binding protein
MILCDTDVFIEAFKNNADTTALLRHIGFENMALSTITLMELYFGAFNKREMTKIKNRVERLKIYEINKEISDTALNLIEKYSKSHGLRIPDALIAATSICKGVDLLTYNLSGL